MKVLKLKTTCIQHLLFDSEIQFSANYRMDIDLMELIKKRITKTI